MNSSSRNWPSFRAAKHTSESRSPSGWWTSSTASTRWCLRRSHVADSEETSSSEGGADELDDDWMTDSGEKPCSEVEAKCERRSHESWRGKFGNLELLNSNLRTVSGMSQATATLFRRAASLRVGIEAMAAAAGGGQRLMILDSRVPGLDGQLSANSLQKEGLGYGQLTELTENGLLHQTTAPGSGTN